MKKISIRQFLYVLPASLLLLVFSSTAFAADGYRPANFDHEDPKRQFAKLLEFPEVKGNITVILNCFSQVESSGKMKDTGCYVKDNFDSTYVNAVAKAAKKARMNPAIVNGKPQRVFLQFRVAFKAEEEDRIIRYYLNTGFEENMQAYGPGFIAGQRVIGKKEPWQGVCPQKAKFSLWARAYLGEDGNVSNISLVHGNGIMPVARCQDAIRQTILASPFTPGISEGVPVPSTFVEVFGN
jgi:hypothetical protein